MVDEIHGKLTLIQFDGDKRIRFRGRWHGAS